MNFWVRLQRGVSETWQANCPTPWTMASLKGLVPEVCAWCTPGKAAVTAWPFISPSFLLLQPPESPSKPALCPTRTPFCTILDHWIKTYLSCVPLSLRVEREFKVTYPSHSKHEYLTTYQMVIFPFAYTPPSKTELVTSTVRHLWLLEYHPCVESNSVSQYLLFTGSGSPLRSRLKNTHLIQEHHSNIWSNLAIKFTSQRGKYF